MARFVLVHGAFHNATCWDRLKKDLEARGHRVEAVDLPGHGSDKTPLEQVTLDLYADKVTQAVMSDPEPPVLVGHSMGGMVVTQAADNVVAAGGKLAQVVYIAAFVPHDGQSLVDLAGLPEGAGDMVQANVVVEGEPPIGTMSVENHMAAFYGDVDPAEARSLAQKLEPQPILAFVQPVHITDNRPLTRRYVVTTKDKALPTPLQRRMSKDNDFVEVVEIESDHSPFISHEPELLDVLDRWAKA